MANMATSRTDIPRWTLVEHGYEHRESNVRRAHRQLKGRFPGISEDEVSDHYEGVLIERVAMPRNADGTWPPGAFEHDDTLEGLDSWIVRALFYELSNYQRHRVRRRESLDESRGDDGEGQLLLADASLDPAAAAEDRDMLDAVARDAPAEVQTYLLLAQAGYRRADIQRATAWSTSRYKWVKAKSEGFVRGRYLSLPAFLVRWTSSGRARGGGAVLLGGGAGATVKAGTALVVGLAVVGGAIELHHPAQPRHGGARHVTHALSRRAAVVPATVAAAPAVVLPGAPSSPSTTKRPAQHAKAATGVPSGLAYLGAPASPASAQGSSTGAGSSPSPAHAAPAGHTTRPGGLSYLGGP
jgi:hypothetical protein